MALAAPIKATQWLYSDPADLSLFDEIMFELNLLEVRTNRDLFNRCRHYSKQLIEAKTTGGICYLKMGDWFASLEAFIQGYVAAKGVPMSVFTMRDDIE